MVVQALIAIGVLLLLGLLYGFFVNRFLGFKKTILSFFMILIILALLLIVYASFQNSKCGTARLESMGICPKVDFTVLTTNGLIIATPVIFGVLLGGAISTSIKKR